MVDGFLVRPIVVGRAAQHLRLPLVCSGEPITDLYDEDVVAMRSEEADPASFEGDAPVATTHGALHNRRELALVALERTRMPIVVTDARQPDYPIVVANQAFLDLIGKDAADVIGRNCRFLQGSDTDPADIAAIREGLKMGQDVNVELLNYRGDGSSFWNQLVISPIYDDAGDLIYHFASQKDVTARRQAEATERAERLLLMEVDHRAMNALALVQSFVRLGRADTVEAYSAAVQLRVDALAKAHRLLARNGWTSAALGELILMGIPETAADRITLSGPPIALDARIVQSVALAFHELMTNALSHGALGTLDGALQIVCTVEHGCARVHWLERGAAPDTHPHEGLGLSLVRGVIERQLGGTLCLDWHSVGLDARLSFPSDGAARAANGGRASSFRSGS